MLREWATQEPGRRASRIPWEKRGQGPFHPCMGKKVLNESELATLWIRLTTHWPFKLVKSVLTLNHLSAQQNDLT